MTDSAFVGAPVELTPEQRAVRDAIRGICADFDRAYWRDRDRDGEYPQAFVDALGEAGWLGITLPERYGGTGLGTAEAIVMFEEIARSGAGFSGAQTVHAAVYTAAPIVRHGNEELKERLLPGVASGETAVQTFALTEPDAGSESTAISTRAVRDGDVYRVTGEKLWTSRIDASDYMVLVARTTPRAEADRKTDGVTLLLVDLGDALQGDGMRIEEIEKTASNVVTSYRVTFDDLAVPVDNRIGAEGDGFAYVLDGLNEERLVIAAECIGLGRAAVERGVTYAADREVFGRPVGANQAVQHPLAEAHVRLGAAKCLVHSGAARADRADADRAEVGVHANAAKYLAADACFEAADAAVQAHGGRGVAREYDVERYLREARLTRLVPVTQELALNYLGETALGLPRSH
jgi:acyl-CoA dehydrogenase